MARIRAAGIAICISSALQAATPPASGGVAGGAALSACPVFVTIDASGRVQIDGHTVTLHQLRQDVHNRVVRRAATMVRVTAEPDVPQDHIDAVTLRLTESGVRTGAITVYRGAPPAATQPHNPRAVGLLVRRFWPSAGGAATTVSADESRIAREVEARGDAIRWRLETIERLAADWFETGAAASRPAARPRGDE